MTNFYINKYKLQPGDRLVTPKSKLRLVQHHVIYLGKNYQGIDLIIENKQGHGVRVITADSFFKEIFEIDRIEHFKGNGAQRKAAVQRALKEVGQPYHLINFNCESFANLVQNNRTHSKQSRTGLSIGLLTLALLFFGAISDSKSNLKSTK